MSEGSGASAPLKEVIARVIDGQSLSQEEAKNALGIILRGEASPVQLSALLVALRLKGESSEEIAGFVEAMREASVSVRPQRQDLIDLCGTGGDGSHTINISTIASIIVAACGLGVAKHGNRSASSQCGSADVLEELGIPIDLAPEKSQPAIDDFGFAFLFARTHHPAMKHVGPVRQELGVRTVFNILGPLSNPADVKRQLIGVFSNDVRSLMAEVLNHLGSEHVWVVHSIDEEGRGLDELSLAGTTFVTELKDGKIENFEVTPEDAGLNRAPLKALVGGDQKHNAQRALAILGGEEGPQTDAVLLNSAAALLIGGKASNLKDGVALAKEVIANGSAKSLLEKLQTTNDHLR